MPEFLGGEEGEVESKAGSLLKRTSPQKTRSSVRNAAASRSQPKGLMDPNRLKIKRRKMR